MKSPSRAWPYWTGLLLLGTVFAIYWPTLSLPYVQDDWSALASSDQRTFLDTVFSLVQRSSHNLLFRPGKSLYFWVVYHCFGLNALPHHIFVLFFHTATALCLVALAGIFFNRGGWAWACGFIYAGAAGLFMDPLSWAVGIGAMGGVFFFLLGLLFFCRHQDLAGALAFYASVLFRDEAASFFPVVCLAILLRQPGGVAGWKEWFKRGWPYALSFLVYLLVRPSVTLPFETNEDHPYHASLGTHIFSNIAHYMGWMFESIVPIHSNIIHQYPERLGLLGICVLVALSLFLWVKKAPSFKGLTLLFLLGWAVTALLPASLLPSHTYRYYALLGWPPVIMIMVFGLREVVRGKKAAAPKGVLVLLLVALGIQLLGSHRFFHREAAKGIYQHYLVGSNRLIRRCAAVNIIKDGLAKHLPEPPKGATIILEGLPLPAIKGETAPRLWYNDPSLWVHDADQIEWREEGAYVQQASWPWWRHKKRQWVALDPQKTFYYRFDGHGLTPVFKPEWEEKKEPGAASSATTEE